MTGRTTYRWFPVVASIFVTCLVTSNIIAVKLIAAGPYALPAGIIVFPISYIFGDILTEVYGYGQARRVIWIGFACNFLAIIVIRLSIAMPSVPFWTLHGFTNADSERAYGALFGFTPRLLAASFGAYLCGEFLNSFVMAKMKIATAGRHLWLRTISSTVAGQLVDSAIFILLAFSGVIPAQFLLELVVSQWIVKSLYEAAATPATYLIVGFLKREEHEDYYDRTTDFNPLLFNRGISAEENS